MGEQDTQVLRKFGESGMICGNGDAPGCEARIDTHVLAALMRSGIHMVILDARSAETDDGRRIPGAKKLRTTMSRAELETAIGPPSALIVSYSSNLYCPESMRLCRCLKTKGYINVLEYLDGLAGWISAGYEVEQSAGETGGAGNRDA